MALTKASMEGSEDRGGKPNPGTKKDKRKTENKRGDADWASELANKSGGLPAKSGPVKL